MTGCAGRPATVPVSPQLEFFPCTDCVLSAIWRERFIVVQGLMPDEGLFGHVVYSYAHGLTFFNAYKEAILADPALSDLLWNLAHILDVPLTSMLLYQSLLGATGSNPLFDLDVNYDLSNRLGMIAPETYDTHTPQVYASW